MSRWKLCCPNTFRLLLVPMAVLLCENVNVWGVGLIPNTTKWPYYCSLSKTTAISFIPSWCDCVFSLSPPYGVCGLSCLEWMGKHCRVIQTTLVVWFWFVARNGKSYMKSIKYNRKCYYKIKLLRSGLYIIPL